MITNDKHPTNQSTESRAFGTSGAEAAYGNQNCDTLLAKCLPKFPMNTKEIKNTFERKKQGLIAPIHDAIHDALSNLLLREKIPLDITNLVSGEILVPAHGLIIETDIDQLVLSCDRIKIDPSPIGNKVRDIIESQLLPIKNELSILEDEYNTAIQQTESYQKMKALEVQAQNGDPQSQHELGSCYYDPCQIWYNRSLAKHWFFKSAIQGNHSAGAMAVSINKGIMLILAMRLNDIVPFSMKLIALDADPHHLFIRNFSACWILPAIQSACHTQPLCGACSGDEFDDRFVVPQGFSSPVGGYERE